MKSTLNKHRLNNLLRGIQTSISLFDSQGHTDVYFTAQFFRGGRKQNCIERGDLLSFAKQVRTYIQSEEADSARIEFFSEGSGKSIYSKAMNDLRISEDAATAVQQAALIPAGLNGFAGLGEAQVAEMVDKKVAEQRRNDEFQRLNKEVDELRAKVETLTTEKTELEATIEAKNNLEFYSGIVGAAFPGLSTLFNGTPLAQAASFLSGTAGGSEKVLPEGEQSNDDAQSVAALVSEFCATLNAQEQASIHLLFMAFESDRSRIQAALHYITSAAPKPTPMPAQPAKS